VDGAAEALRDVRAAARDEVVVQFADPRLVAGLRRYLGDAAAHQAAAQHRDPADLRHVSPMSDTVVGAGNMGWSACLRDRAVRAVSAAVAEQAELEPAAPRGRRRIEAVTTLETVEQARQLHLCSEHLVPE